MDTQADLAPENSPRDVYVRLVCTRIAEKEAKLAYVKSKIERAVESGRIAVSEQLRNAQRQADARLLIARERLDQLAGADDGRWEELKHGLDMACDDLSDSLKKFVARVN